MALSKIETALIKSMADLAIHTTELGKTQMEIANFISQNVPTLSEPEKQEILALSESSWLQVQSLQDKAKKLQGLL